MTGVSDSLIIRADFPIQIIANARERTHGRVENSRAGRQARPAVEINQVSATPRANSAWTPERRPRSLVAAGNTAVRPRRAGRYLLLAFTVAFACVTGTIAAAMNVPFLGGLPGLIVYLVGFFGLSFLVNKTANSVWGLFWTFMFTGLHRFRRLVPAIVFWLHVHRLHRFRRGRHPGGVVAQAFGVTAATFLGLSIYTISTKKDFSFLRSFLVIGFFVVIGIIICSLFFDLSAFAATISAAMVLIACALMLYQTSEIVRGGETNYIIATNNLFVSVYLLFMNLLRLFGIMGGDD